MLVFLRTDKLEVERATGRYLFYIHIFYSILPLGNSVNDIKYCYEFVIVIMLIAIALHLG